MRNLHLSNMVHRSISFNGGKSSGLAGRSCTSIGEDESSGAVSGAAPMIWAELSAPQDKDDVWWLTGKKRPLVVTLQPDSWSIPYLFEKVACSPALVKLVPVLSVLLLCRPICRLPRCAECRLISFTTLAASSRYALKIHPPGPANTSSWRTQNLIFPACLDCWTTILTTDIWFLHWACGCKAYVWNVEPKCPVA